MKSFKKHLHNIKRDIVILKQIKLNFFTIVMIAISFILVMICMPLLNGNNDDKPQSILIAVLLSISVSLTMILIERGVNSFLRIKQFSYLIRDDYKSYGFTGSTEIEKN